MQNEKLENIVIVILIIVGVALGIYYRTQNDSQLSAVLLSLALASVLYKFLGGNDADNSLSIGVLKFGGSAAVLGGFIWLLSQVIFQEDNVAGLALANQNTIQISPNNGWYPADITTNKIIPINISAGETTVKFPSDNFEPALLTNRQFSLKSEDGSDFLLYPPNNTEDVLGHVYLDQIEGLPEVKNVNFKPESNLQTFFLYPNVINNRNNKEELKLSNTKELEKQLIKRKKRKNDFPFPFEVNVYGSSFEVIYRDKKDPILSDLEVIPRRAFFIASPDENDKKAYLLMVLHANFTKKDLEEHYSEWAVCQINLD